MILGKWSVPRRGTDLLTRISPSNPRFVLQVVSLPFVFVRCMSSTAYGGTSLSGTPFSALDCRTSHPGPESKLNDIVLAMEVSMLSIEAILENHPDSEKLAVPFHSVTLDNHMKLFAPIFEFLLYKPAPSKDYYVILMKLFPRIVDICHKIRSIESVNLLKLLVSIYATFNAEDSAFRLIEKSSIPERTFGMGPPSKHEIRLAGISGELYNKILFTIATSLPSKYLPFLLYCLASLDISGAKKSLAEGTFALLETFRNENMSSVESQHDFVVFFAFVLKMLCHQHPGEPIHASVVDNMFVREVSALSVNLKMNPSHAPAILLYQWLELLVERGIYNSPNCTTLNAALLQLLTLKRFDSLDMVFRKFQLMYSDKLDATSYNFYTSYLMKVQKFSKAFEFFRRSADLFLKPSLSATPVQLEKIQNNFETLILYGLKSLLYAGDFSRTLEFLEEYVYRKVLLVYQGRFKFAIRFGQELEKCVLCFVILYTNENRVDFASVPIMKFMNRFKRALVKMLESSGEDLTLMREYNARYYRPLFASNWIHSIELAQRQTIEILEATLDACPVLFPSSNISNHKISSNHVEPLVQPGNTPHDGFPRKEPILYSESYMSDVDADSYIVDLLQMLVRHYLLLRCRVKRPKILLFLRKQLSAYLSSANAIFEETRCPSSGLDIEENAPNGRVNFAGFFHDAPHLNVVFHVVEDFLLRAPARIQLKFKLGCADPLFLLGPLVFTTIFHWLSSSKPALLVKIYKYLMNNCRDGSFKVNPFAANGMKISVNDAAPSDQRFNLFKMFVDSKSLPFLYSSFIKEHEWDLLEELVINSVHRLRLKACFVKSPNFQLVMSLFKIRGYLLEHSKSGSIRKAVRYFEKGPGGLYASLPVKHMLDFNKKGLVPEFEYPLSNSSDFQALYVRLQDDYFQEARHRYKFSFGRNNYISIGKNLSLFQLHSFLSMHFPKAKNVGDLREALGHPLLAGEDPVSDLAATRMRVEQPSNVAASNFDCIINTLNAPPSGNSTESAESEQGSTSSIAGSSLVYQRMMNSLILAIAIPSFYVNLQRLLAS